MTKSFEQSLSELKNATIAVVADDIPDAEGTASIVVKFSDGTVLNAAYWRLVQDGRALFSSFDHKNKYGLPAPFDAKEQLSILLNAKICIDVKFDRETADLNFLFDGTTKLQVFNFTAYEIWQLNFRDGTVEYSNHALR